MTLVQTCLALPIPQAEKLLLVYLAAGAGGAGLALMPDKEQIAKDLDCSDRTVSRSLKALRDSGHVALEGRWCWIKAGGQAQTIFTPPPASEFVTILDGHPASQLADWFNAQTRQINNLQAVVLKGIMDSESTIIRRIEELADGIGTTQPAPEPEPPPDPVKESDLYKQLIELGIDEPVAYEQAAKKVLAPDHDAAPTMHAIAKAPVDLRDLYEDTPNGRLSRVADILRDHVTPEVWKDWLKFEASENRETAKGETSAFELLYPAIVQAAKRVSGTMTLAQFLDPQAIREYRAPWDVYQEGAGMQNDVRLQSEIAVMLDDIARWTKGAGSYMPGPRQTEVDDETGAHRTEPLAAYHRRVTGAHRQAKQLYEMGVFEDGN